jgi:aerobic-type carbon monoxide dehydrogenase small subunit (CoxS/CutS family)
MSLVKLLVNGATTRWTSIPRRRCSTCCATILICGDLDFGCGLGQCSACSVLIDGNAVRSCITPVAAVRSEITTLEGLATDGNLHPLQQAWIDEQAPQCGYCQNGQILTAKALLDRNPKPSDAEIREAMDGALCRCMTYFRVQAAIKRVVSGAPAAGEGK